MENAYEPRDLQFKKLKQIYQSELQGSSLKQMHAQKNARLLNARYEKLIKENTMKKVSESRPGQEENLHDLFDVTENNKKEKIIFEELTHGARYINFQLDKLMNPHKHRHRSMKPRKKTYKGQSMASLAESGVGKESRRQLMKSQRTLANVGKSILANQLEARDTNFYNYAVGKKIDSKQFQNTFIRLKNRKLRIISHL